MISIYQDGDCCAFEQMGPAAKSSHDSEEFAIIDGVVLLSLSEFLGVESHQSLWSWFLRTVWFGDRGVPLIEDCACSNL